MLSPSFLSQGPVESAQASKERALEVDGGAS